MDTRTSSRTGMGSPLLSGPSRSTTSLPPVAKETAREGRRLKESAIPFDEALEPAHSALRQRCPNDEVLWELIGGQLRSKSLWGWLRVWSHVHVRRCPDCQEAVQSLGVGFGPGKAPRLQPVWVHLVVVVTLLNSWLAYKAFDRAGRLAQAPAPIYRSPAPVVAERGGHALELTLFRYKTPKDKPRVDEYSPALVLGDMLLLQTSPVSEKFRAILAFGGDGQAQIYPEAVLAEMGWGWTITGPPPSETIILLVSNQPLPANLASWISALGITPTLTEGTQIVWHDDTPEVRQSDRPLRSPQRLADLGWADRVREVLRSVQGLEFHGRTLPVEAKASRS